MVLMVDGVPTFDTIHNCDTPTLIEANRLPDAHKGNWQDFREAVSKGDEDPHEEQSHATITISSSASRKRPRDDHEPKSSAPKRFTPAALHVAKFKTTINPNLKTDRTVAALSSVTGDDSDARESEPTKASSAQLPDELILKILKLDQVKCVYYGVDQPAPFALALGLTNRRYYTLLKSLFPGIIYIGRPSIGSDPIRKVVRCFLGPNYRYLHFSTYTHGAHPVFGNCAVYPRPLPQSAYHGIQGFVYYGLSAEEHELKKRYACRGGTSRTWLVHEYRCPLPNPFNMGRKWYDEAWGVMTGERWSTMMKEVHSKEKIDYKALRAEQAAAKFVMLNPHGNEQELCDRDFVFQSMIDNVYLRDQEEFIQKEASGFVVQDMGPLGRKDCEKPKPTIRPSPLDS